MYYGKYRAIVTNIEDPEKWGRVKVKCPMVLGEYESNWCMPCVPYLNNYKGMFTLPDVGDGVWIEFEEGKLNKPIYVGGWFNPNKYPGKDYKDLQQKFLITTKKGNSVLIDDTKEIITIKTHKGSIVIDDSKDNITIKATKIEVKGELITEDVNIKGSLTTRDKICKC